MGSHSGSAMVNCQHALLIVLTVTFLVCLDGVGRVSRNNVSKRKTAITKEKYTEESSNKKIKGKRKKQKTKYRKRKKEQIKTMSLKGKKYNKNKRVKTLI